MPKQPVKGTKQVLFELPEQLVEDAKAFAKKRSESLKDVVIQALHRHMANPPPLPTDTPLPPVTVAESRSGEQSKSPTKKVKK
jgi:hypothetical protein